jgi:hypothetical protein
MRSLYQVVFKNKKIKIKFFSQKESKDKQNAQRKSCGF